MKKGVITLCILLTRLVAEGQYSEFKTFDNGLIYDPQTMNRLSAIVDSLNLKFRSCDLSHPYYSLFQGQGYYVELTKMQRKAVGSGITLEAFRRRFPNQPMREIWVVKRKFRDYQGVARINYSDLPHGGGSQSRVWVKDNPANNKEMGWVIDEDGESAIFLNGLKRTVLPTAYARQVQYVDCMIDTTAEIFLTSAEPIVYQQVKPNTKAASFLEWTESYPGKPGMLDYDKIEKLDLDFDSVYDVYIKAHRIWDSLRMTDLDEKFEKSHYWKSLLMEARDEGIANGNTDSRLEFYVMYFLSKEDALKLKRSRRVMGGCSQDLSPRLHAIQISMLAAETAKWDIFLRSHLDVMNDNFERQTDGSYAWEGRKTYLRELEELDIHATDLLIGSCIRVDNVSPGHYDGDISRIGRALAEASDRDAVEAQLVGLVENEQMDTYNRLIFSYLLSHYAANLTDEAHKQRMSDQLKSLVKKFPALAQKAWEK